MYQIDEDNSSASELIEDLLILILIRLPVRSLLRFRCVSKSWHALITSQEFAKLHLDRSLTHSNPHLIMFPETTWKPPFPRLLWAKFFQKRPGLHLLTAEFSEPENFAFDEIQFHEIYKSRIIHLVGSCNGLLCFSEFYSTTNSLVLCNPLTRSYWTLTNDSLAPDGISCRDKIPCFAGFGYDDVHDEYKVVRFFDRKVRFEVEVYGLKSKSWKRAADLYHNDIELCGFARNYAGVLVDCTLNWLCVKNFILAIDLRTEKHRILLPPKGVDSSRYPQLSTLNGCLCWTYKWDGINIDLWILKDNKVNDSWTKITVQLPHPPRCVRPVMHLEGQKIMVFENGVEIIWYHQVQKRVTFKTAIPGSRAFFCQKMLPFIGSLVEPWGQQ